MPACFTCLWSWKSVNERDRERWREGERKKGKRSLQIEIYARRKRKTLHLVFVPLLHSVFLAFNYKAINVHPLDGMVNDFRWKTSLLRNSLSRLIKFAGVFHCRVPRATLTVTNFTSILLRLNRLKHYNWVFFFLYNEISDDNDTGLECEFIYVRASDSILFTLIQRKRSKIFLNFCFVERQSQLDHNNINIVRELSLTLNISFSSVIFFFQVS